MSQTPGSPPPDRSIAQPAAEHALPLDRQGDMLTAAEIESLRADSLATAEYAKRAFANVEVPGRRPPKQPPEQRSAGMPDAASSGLASNGRTDSRISNAVKGATP